MTLSDSGAQPFLPSSVYGSAAIAQQERERYAPQFWHPVASLDALPQGHSLALDVRGCQCCSPEPKTAPQPL